MSWKDNLELEFIIQTGDEKEYRPKGWLRPSFEKKFNISKFEFPNIPGTYIRKTEPKGRVYNMEIYFQGDDHLIEAAAFELSAEDKRHWHVIHPYYGDIRVQPSTLRFDNTDQNLTKITGPLLETILGDLPRGNFSFKDIIVERKALADITFSETYETNVPEPTVQDEIRLTDDFKVLTKDINKLIITQEESNTLNELVSKANASISNFGQEPLVAMRDIQSTINFPVILDQTLDARLNLLLTQFESTVGTIVNFPLEQLILSQKAYFETIASTLLGAIALVVSNNQSPDDYGNRSNVLSIIDKIIGSNNLYISTLDNIQSGNGTQQDSFIPDAESLREINSILDFTISNLFEIAFESKQEREIIVEQDSNIILLTHRLYGLDQEDENMNELIRNNNYGITDHLGIKQGAVVKYFTA